MRRLISGFLVFILIFFSGYIDVFSATYQMKDGEFLYYAEAPAYQGSGPRYSLEEFTLHNGCDPKMDPRGTGYVSAKDDCNGSSTQWAKLPMENCDSWTNPDNTTRFTECIISQETVNNAIRAAGMTGISDGDTVYVSGGFGA